MNSIEEKIKMEKQSTSKEKFIDTLKIDEKVINSVIERKKFLKKLEGNEELFNMLSIERLQKLEKYYNTIIEENNQIIARLKKQF